MRSCERTSESERIDLFGEVEICKDVFKRSSNNWRVGLGPKPLPSGKIGFRLCIQRQESFNR